MSDLGGRTTQPPSRLIIQEVDGAPLGRPTAFKFPSGTITDNGDGTFTYTPAGGGGGAPTDAGYVVTAANGTLSAESLLSDVIGRGVTGSRPAAGVAGRLYFDTSTSILYRDNGSSWDSVEGSSGGGGSSDTFDPTVKYLEESFSTGNGTSGQVGRLGMVWSGPSVAVVAVAAGEPGGHWRGVTGATNPSAGSWTPRATPTTGLLLPNDTAWEIGWTFKPRLNAGAAGSTVVRVGASSDPGTTGQASHGIYLEKAAGDTNYFLVCRASSVETRTDTAVAFADDPAAPIRILLRRAAVGGNIGFRINAGSEVTIGTNIPTAALMPQASIITSEAVAKHMDPYHFYIKWTGLTGRNYS